MKAPTTACGLPAPLSGRQLTKKCDLELANNCASILRCANARQLRYTRIATRLQRDMYLAEAVFTVQLFWDSRRRYLHLSKEKQGWDLNA
jgi:hypothetical protein